MIRNEAELTATSDILKAFKNRLAEHKKTHGNVKPGDMQYLVRQGLDGQIEELEFEINAYQSLIEKRSVGLRELTELGPVLKMARIVKKMSQKQLAEKLGIKQQQLQRYESKDYHNVALDRVAQVVEVLDFDFYVDDTAAIAVNHR